MSVKTPIGPIPSPSPGAGNNFANNSWNNFGNDFGNNFGNDFGNNFGNDFGNDFGSNSGGNSGSNSGSNSGGNSGNDFGGNFGNDFGGNFGSTAGNGSNATGGEKIGFLAALFSKGAAAATTAGEVYNPFSWRKIAFVVIAIVVILLILYALYWYFFKRDKGPDCSYVTRELNGDVWACPDGTIDTGRDWNTTDGGKQCAESQECVDALEPIAKDPCRYTVRIPDGKGSWACPSGFVDTKRGWEHVDGDKQCQTDTCPPPGPPVLKPGGACDYSVRVDVGGGKWACPKDKVDTGRDWTTVDGGKQCASTQKCADALGPVKPLPTPNVCSVY